MKWHFSQFKTKFLSSYLLSTRDKLTRHASKSGPKTEKSSIKISMHVSIRSEKIAYIYLWKAVGALHSPEWHSPIGKHAVRAGESRLLLICWINMHLVIPR